ncbi:MAG: substrate-binding domain-containing protein, partial [Chloroflexota bacterium]
NPLQLTGLAGLAQAGLRFVNRQPGSGTRVWLDAMLARGGPVRQAIGGYGYEVATHSEVARAVAEGRADAGLGLESAALVYGLDFVFLVRERYDLVVPEEGMEAPALARLTRWLGTEPARRLIQEQGGYEVEQTGQVEWVA